MIWGERNTASTGETALGDGEACTNGTSTHGYGSSEGCASSHSPYNGIYIRPTVFMINGSATHLMRTLYPFPLPFASLSQRDGKETAWWGCRNSQTPPLWVLFDYTMCVAVPAVEHLNRDIIASDMRNEFTNEELVCEDLAPSSPTAAAAWRAAAKHLSCSLRENRLSAPFVATRCVVLGELEQKRGTSAYLRGSQDVLLSSGFPLLQGVEVALHAMRPGDEFAFFVLNPNPCDDDVNSFARDMCGAPRYMHIHIKLHRCLLPEPYVPPVLQKYIVRLPPAAVEEVAMTRVRSWGMSLFRFFHHEFLFSHALESTQPEAALSARARCAFLVAVVSAAGNCHSVGLPPPQQMLSGGRPSAVLTQFYSVAPSPPYSRGEEERPIRRFDHSNSNEDPSENGIICDDDGDDSGCNGGDLTDEEALTFLRFRFFSVPRDGATVSCSVVREGLLGESVPPPEQPSHDGLLGSRALPSWLDVVLQTMQCGEEAVVKVDARSEDDGAFHFLFARSLQELMKAQLSLMDKTRLCCMKKERDEEKEEEEEEKEEERQKWQEGRVEKPQDCEDLDGVAGTAPSPLDMDLSQNSYTQQYAPTTIDEVSYNSFLLHDDSYRVVLDSFANVYDTGAFFFADPVVSLQVVQRLRREARALVTTRRRRDNEGHTASTSNCDVDADADADEADVNADDDDDKDAKNEDRRSSSSGTPACVTAEMWTFSFVSFGHLSRRPLYRGVVKAIQKMNFAVLLLSFNVDEECLVKRGVSPELMLRRRAALGDVFRHLCILYMKLPKDAYELADDAYAAAIAYAPEHRPPCYYHAREL
ncbi:hypothetical protein DQ04_04611010 [Trypanosoma grayi]|uniref:hypothetical protein n=1 Tax=Trypanosoma grayi TaxID=71804 RepID=UPI0004F3F30B|nr:hypothetical protein DQ04_04611010 [Trypanosoma grayi]KEG09802.1 hypothetical protein DQ04_04611010 [Trypanosoma grayi]